MICCREFVVQYKPLYVITLGQTESDYINRMIQLTDVFCVLFWNNGTSISDYNNRLIQLSVIQLSGWHCTLIGTLPGIVVVSLFRYFVLFYLF